MPNVEHTEAVAYEAKGLASEAIQAVRSHEQLDNLRFTNMDRQVQEIKQVVEDQGKAYSEQIKALNEDVRYGFRRIDQKFWGLAIGVISLLIGILGSLLYVIANRVTLHG